MRDESSQVDELTTFDDSRRKHDDLLAVHSISHTTMSRNTISKVFNVKGSLESTGKEPSKRSYQGRKGTHYQTVNLKGGIGE